MLAPVTISERANLFVLRPLATGQRLARVRDAPPPLAMGHAGGTLADPDPPAGPCPGAPRLDPSEQLRGHPPPASGLARRLLRGGLWRGAGQSPRRGARLVLMAARTGRRHD